MKKGASCRVINRSGLCFGMFHCNDDGGQRIDEA